MRRRASGCETLTHFALALRLCAARCLRRLGRLDEAEYAFKVLAGGASACFFFCFAVQPARRSSGTMLLMRCCLACNQSVGRAGHALQSGRFQWRFALADMFALLSPDT